MEKEITFDRFVRGLIVVLGLVLAIVAINYLSSVLVPFIVAWFIAYLIFPVVHFFETKLHLKSRILSIIVTLMLIGGIVYGFVALSIPSVNYEVDQFKATAERFFTNEVQNKSIPPRIREFINAKAQQFNVEKLTNSKDLVNLVKEAAPKVWNVIYQTAGVVIAIIGSFIAVIYLFFILVDFEKLQTGIRRMIPRSKRRFFNTLMSDLSAGMNSYFRGQALISLCVGILFCVGFLIIGFPLAIPLGITIGILSLVPYLHVLGLVPAVLLSLMKAAETGQNFWLILVSALAVFLIVQMIQDLVLTPRIMGKAMSLPPFLILLSLSVWGCLLGIIGMIIALPLTTIIISYYKRYVVKDKLEKVVESGKTKPEK